MINIPEQFAKDTIIREGDPGRLWIEALPHLLDSLCSQWNLLVDGPVMHGYLGVVVPVQRGEESCALKVAWVDESTVDEASALIAWNGRGAVRLLEHLPEQGAMLLERLDHTRSLNKVEITKAVAIAGRLLRRLTIPAPQGIQTQLSTAEKIFETLPDRWERFGRPMHRRLLDFVRELTGQLGTPVNHLLVNYDLHYDDVLVGEREPWLAVDPKVVAGDPEFGIAQLFWTRLEDIEEREGLERNFRVLIDAAELDPELARAWTIIRCVDYWLWGLSVGLTYDPARCERIIELLI